MSKYRIFDPAPLPLHHRANLDSIDAYGLIWSQEFKEFVARLSAVGALKRRVAIRAVAGCEPYDDTYHADLQRLPAPLRRELSRYAKDLATRSPMQRLGIFRDMFTSPISRDVIRILFAYLRGALTEIAGDARAALYAPVTPVYRDRGFKLHADLFLTTRLWLVFDHVPNDGSGATLLLPRRDLARIARGLEEMPAEIGTRILDLMRRPLAKDSFNELYTLLHTRRHPWYGSLSAAMKCRCATIALRSGEGYLLDDREWLHGRMASSEAVTGRRFHRLTFGLR